MRGFFAEHAEVARVRGQPATEVLLPHAVHHHARRERILRRSEPLRERAAATCAVRQRNDLRRRRVEKREHARLYFAERLLFGNEHRRRDRADIRRGEGHRQGLVLVHRGELAAQGENLLLVVTFVSPIHPVPIVDHLTPRQRGDLRFERRALGGGLANHRLNVVGETRHGV